MMTCTAMPCFIDYYYDYSVLFFPPIELPAPENVNFVKSDTTSIDISWKLFTLVELKALVNYTVTYSAASTPNVANTINVPWTENGITITNLNPGTRYDITVTTTTSSRMSGMFFASTSLVPTKNLTTDVALELVGDND